MGLLQVILAALKAVGIALGWLHDESLVNQGRQLQQGADDEQTLDVAKRANAAADAVQPLRPDGLRADGTPDPDFRD